MSTAGSCESATSPINMASANAFCSKICDYKYSYALSDCQLINQGDYLEIQTSKSGNMVTFNNLPYNMVGARLYQPSLHTFSGSHLSGELIIQHMGGESNLLICIPITTSNGKSKSVDFFNAFIPYAPQSKGGQTNVNVNNWSFNNVIPIGGYYFYKATLPFPPCIGSYNIVVFGKSDAAQISNTDLPHLTAAIQRNTLSTKSAPDGGLYYNKAGTTSHGGGEASDIYIDCKPVGSQEMEDSDVRALEIPKTFNFPSLREIIDSPYAAVGIGVILLIIFKKLYNKILDKL